MPDSRDQLQEPTPVQYADAPGAVLPGALEQINPRAMTHAASRAESLVFRLRLSITLVSIPFTLGFVAQYLYFDTLIGTLGRLFGFAEYVTQMSMLATGGTVLGLASGGRPSRTWFGREVLGTGGVSFLQFLIGYAAVIGIVALVLTATDSRLDREAIRRRMAHYLRFAIATVMLVYASVKVIPTQFGALTPADLVTPYGARSGFWVLWDFMAASTGYTIFCGLSELVGSLLLCFRRTSILGGVVIAGVMFNVLALNIAYNINAVGAATTILAMDLAFIAPALPSMLRFMLGARAEVLELPGTLVRTARPRVWVTAKLVVLSLMLTTLTLSGVARLRDYHRVGQPWFGAYEVTAFNAGAALPDSLRWKRVASDARYGSAPRGSGLRIQTADDRWHRYGSQLDSAAHVMTLSALDRRSASLRVYYATDSAGVTLSTDIAGDSVTVRLRPIDLQPYSIFREW